VIKQVGIQIETDGRGVYDLTSRVQSAVETSGVRTGICSVFIHHTSASLMLCENADPAVMHDLESFMQRLTPDGDPLFTHTAEGPDDMSAHVRSVLTQSDLSIPIRDGSCDLGTWQGVYLWEHRFASHKRRITVTILGQL
jgi:secondary thiamine-phosphate synthase enzyme